MGRGGKARASMREPRRLALIAPPQRVGALLPSEGQMSDWIFDGPKLWQTRPKEYEMCERCVGTGSERVGTAYGPEYRQCAPCKGIGSLIRRTKPQSIAPRRGGYLSADMAKRIDDVIDNKYSIIDEIKECKMIPEYKRISWCNRISSLPLRGEAAAVGWTELLRDIENIDRSELDMVELFKPSGNCLRGIQLSVMIHITLINSATGDT